MQNDSHATYLRAGVHLGLSRKRRDTSEKNEQETAHHVHLRKPIAIVRTQARVQPSGSAPLSTF